MSASQGAVGRRRWLIAFFALCAAQAGRAQTDDQTPDRFDTPETSEAVEEPIKQDARFAALFSSWVAAEGAQARSDEAGPEHLIRPSSPAYTVPSASFLPPRYSANPAPAYSPPASFLPPRYSANPAPAYSPPATFLPPRYSASPAPAYSPPVPLPRYGCSESGSCYGEISPDTGKPKTVYVPGYYKSNGKYVRGYFRSQ